MVKKENKNLKGKIHITGLLHEVYKVIFPLQCRINRGLHKWQIKLIPCYNLSGNIQMLMVDWKDTKYDFFQSHEHGSLRMML